jgi:hypothetical protein
MTAALDAYRAPAASTVKSQMCVGVERTQASIKHGQAAQFVVSVYTTGATTTHASVAVSAAPAGQRAALAYGCGKQDGTAACTLGTVAVGAAVHQVQAQITVPATSTATAVRLTAAVSADHLPVKPQASVTVVVTAGTGASSGKPTNFLTSAVFQNPSYLPLVGPAPGGNLKGKSILSPGGNASGLFPELTPGAQAAGSGPAAAMASPAREASAVALAGDSVNNAQVAGLAALALALLLVASSPRLRTRVAAALPPGVRLTGIPRPRVRLPRIPWI